MTLISCRSPNPGVLPLRRDGSRRGGLARLRGTTETVGRTSIRSGRSYCSDVFFCSRTDFGIAPSSTCLSAFSICLREPPSYQFESACYIVSCISCCVGTSRTARHCSSQRLLVESRRHCTALTVVGSSLYNEGMCTQNGVCRTKKPSTDRYEILPF